MLFVLAALLAGLGDLGHTLFGVLAYPENGIPKLPYQPIWVFLVFGMAGVGLGEASRRFRIVQGFSFETVSIFQVTFAASLFLGQYFLSSWVSQFSDGVAHLTLGTLAVFSYAVLYRGSKGVLPYLASAAFVGTLMEALLSYLGLFHYLDRHVDFIGVPSWLPWLYVTAALAATTLEQFLALRFHQKK